MNVFISWSGPVSLQFAGVLRDWLPDVIQAIKPWVSADDIDKGTVWNAELNGQLADVRFGIICITPENANSPWLAFEAGAMSVNKGIGKQHVAPVLLGLRKPQLTGPLTQFQLSDFDEYDMRRLVRTLNKALQTEGLAEERLDRGFERMWPTLAAQEVGLSRALAEQGEASAKRPVPDMLSELVELGRAQSRQLETVNEGLRNLAVQTADYRARLRQSENEARWIPRRSVRSPGATLGARNSLLDDVTSGAVTGSQEEVVVTPSTPAKSE